MQPKFFEPEERFKKLDKKDPLVNLDKLIDRENFRSSLNKIRQKDRKPFDVVTIPIAI